MPVNDTMSINQPLTLTIDVSPARVEERPVLRHLMELYQYDFSEFDGSEIGP